MKTCAICEKETDDLFYLNHSSLIDPSTGAIHSVGNGFCLSCYMKKTSQIQAKKGDNYVL